MTLRFFFLLIFPVLVDETTLAIPGTGREPGADEDDFHLVRRHAAELDRDEKSREKAKRQFDLKIGAHSGVVKSFSSHPKSTKKVIHF